jgi:hypothetical protein
MLSKLVVLCTNTVGSNPTDGRTKDCQLEIVTLTMLGWMFICSKYLIHHSIIRSHCRRYTNIVWLSPACHDYIHSRVQTRWQIIEYHRTINLDNANFQRYLYCYFLETPCWVRKQLWDYCYLKSILAKQMLTLF